MADGAAVWYSLGWDQWLGVIGLPLTLFGLWLSWRQARAAASSAEAARNAVYQTQRQLTSKYVQLLVPQLAWISNDLSAAIEEDNVRLVKYHLDNWRRHANNVHGLLSEDSDAEKSLRVIIMSSVSLARVARNGLARPAKQPLARRCVRAQEAITDTCDQLTRWSARTAAQVVIGDAYDG